MSNIRLNTITKKFGTTDVLKGVDLDIEDKEFVTLVGPSGCGKSTLLRILAGLEQPDEGQVLIDGKNVTTTRAADRNLSMVFQSYALYPHLTIRQNMMTPLKLRDLSTSQRLPFIGPFFARKEYKDLLSQVDRTAKILKITELLGRKPGQLSGGQRQRAALGRAMVRNPLAFLMDEPLSNLDAALRVHMRSELTQLHQRLGATFVYVTHDQAEALTMSDRMAVMMHGKILQYGSPEDIYQNPATTEVAKFIGSPAINILSATVNDYAQICIDNLVLDLFAPTQEPKISIGARPEHLTFSDKTSSSISGFVHHIENLGADLFYHVKIKDEERPVVIRAAVGNGKRYQVDDLVHFELDLNSTLAFASDGTRLQTHRRLMDEIAS